MKWIKRNWKKMGVLAVAFVMTVLVMPSEVAAAETVTVTYNMGELGDEVKQDYEVGTVIILTDADLVEEEGWYIVAWGIDTDDGIIDYQYYPGDSYTVDENVTLVAKCSEDTVTVTFDTGGYGLDEDELVYPYGSRIKLPESNYVEVEGSYIYGWGIDSGDETEGEIYAPGDTYTVTEDVVFSIIWGVESTEADDTDTTPQTGDDSNMMMWLVLVMGACVGIGAFSKKIKQY